MCPENRTGHILTNPRSETTKAEIQRFHRTLRAEFLTRLVFDSLEEAQTHLDEWVGPLNHERPYSAFEMNTPANRFTSAWRERPADNS